MDHLSMRLRSFPEASLNRIEATVTVGFLGMIPSNSIQETTPRIHHERNHVVKCFFYFGVSPFSIRSGWLQQAVAVSQLR